MRFIGQCLFFLFVSSTLSFAQNTIGNEWINYGENYIRISITEDGVYAISVEEMLAAGLTSGSFDPSYLRLFLMGKEVPLKLDTTSSNGFNGKSTILFYAEKNKGWLDSLVYRPSSSRMNEQQSLYSDEAVYFLTLDKNVKGRRAGSYIYLNGQIVNYQIGKAGLYFENQYSFNNSIGQLPNLQQSYYEPGEGWTGKFYAADSVSHFRLNLPNAALNTGKEGVASIQVNGRSLNPHELQIKINGRVVADSLRFGFFDKAVVNFNLLETDLALGHLAVEIIPNAKAIYDWYSVTNIQAEYPEQLTTVTSERTLKTDAKYLEVTIGTGLPVVTKNLYNVTWFPLQNGKVNIFENAEYYAPAVYKKPNALSLKRFQKQGTAGYNYYILTNTLLAESALAYENYRASVAGGSFKTKVLYMNELYDEYSYGFKTPVAVNRFAQEVLSDATESKFLLLLGRGVSFPDVMKKEASKDLVTTYGYPGSDVLLTAGTGKYAGTEVQGMPTGRLNVTTNQQVLNYLEKVKEFEAVGNDFLWKKNMLHLSGGADAIQIIQLAEILSEVSKKASSGALGGIVESRRKASLQEIEQIDISEEVNNGVGMITFAGHGSSNTLDLNIGYCSAPNSLFDNKGKYPIMYFNGCGVGNVFYRYDPLTTDWLLTPNRGAIAVFANSFWSYTLPTELFLRSFYETAFVNPDTRGLRLGEIHQVVNSSLDPLNGNPYIRSSMDQIILQGDPALKVFDIEKPELSIKDDLLIISSVDATQSMVDNEELNLQFTIVNTGEYKVGAKTNVKVTTRTVNGENIIDYQLLIPARDTTVMVKIVNPNDVKSISVMLNDDAAVDEYSMENNEALLSFENWEDIAASTSYPLAVIADETKPLLDVKVNGRILRNEDYISKNAVFEINIKDENALVNAEGIAQLTLFNESNGETIVVGASEFSAENIRPNELHLTVNKNLNVGDYLLTAVAQDMAGNKPSQYQIRFKVVAERQPSQLRLGNNPVNIRDGYLELILETIAPENPEYINVRIMDAKGRLMQAFSPGQPQIGKNIYQLPVEILAPGAYIVTMDIQWREDIEKLSTRLINK